MSEEWTEWQEHDGKGCPCKGMWVRTEERGGLIEEHIAEGVRSDAPFSAWNWEGWDTDIIRYRVRKPRALLQLIEMVENLPAPAQPRVDA